MSDGSVKYGFLDPNYASFPPVVQIALVSGVCPSNCRYCPCGQYNMGELSSELAAEMKVRYFPYDLFQEIAAEMAEHTWSILRIHSRGEPMVHRDFVRMIAFAKERGVGTVTSFTNGIYLTQYADDLLRAGIDLLEVSADAADPERYVEWRRNPHFADVVAGVTGLFQARNAIPNCPTRIVVSAVDHPDFRPHRSQFEEFWGRICDKVIVRPFHTYGGRIADPYVRAREGGEHVPCVQLWERFSISPEGLVNACFNDWGDSEVVGDLRTPGASIAAIWRNETFDAVRERTLVRPVLQCCHTCSGPSLSSWGRSGYQYWVRELLQAPPNAGGRSRDGL